MAFLFPPHVKTKGTRKSCAATVLLPGDLLAMLPASSQWEQQLKLLPATCCHVQQIRWEIKGTRVTTKRNQHFQNASLWLILKCLLQDDTYHILKGPFPLYWSYWEPGETCSALSVCFQLWASMLSPSESHEGPWNCDVRPTARWWKGDGAGGPKDPSPALRIRLRRNRTQVSSPAQSQEQSSPVAAHSVTPHSHDVHTYTCHHTHLHLRSGIPSLDLSLSKNLVSISSVSCF